MLVSTVVFFLIHPSKYLGRSVLIFVLLGMNFLLVFILSGFGERFLADAIKILLFFGFSFTLFQRPEYCRRFLTLSSYMGLSLLLAYYLFSSNPMSYGGRLSIEFEGAIDTYTISPNTIGFFINMSLVSLLLSKSPLKFFFFSIAIAGLVLTNSRGAYLCTFFICVLFIGNRYRLSRLTTFSVGFLMASLPVAVILNGVFGGIGDSLRLFDATGSGRTWLWGYLLLRLVESPINLFIGFGPGAVDYEIYTGHSLRSTHNGYLEILFNFGLLGFVIFVSFLYRLALRFRSFSTDAKLYILLILVYMVSEDVFGAHMLLFLSIMTAVIISEYSRSGLRHPNLHFVSRLKKVG